MPCVVVIGLLTAPMHPNPSGYHASKPVAVNRAAQELERRVESVLLDLGTNKTAFIGLLAEPRPMCTCRHCRLELAADADHRPLCAPQWPRAGSRGARGGRARGVRGGRPATSPRGGSPPSAASALPATDGCRPPGPRAGAGRRGRGGRARRVSWHDPAFSSHRAPLRGRPRPPARAGRRRRRPRARRLPLPSPARARVARPQPPRRPSPPSRCGATPAR